jgi:hypothetical protein
MEPFATLTTTTTTTTITTTMMTTTTTTTTTTNSHTKILKLGTPDAEHPVYTSLENEITLCSLHSMCLDEKFGAPDRLFSPIT